MGSYDVNKVNLKLLEHYCSNFEYEKENYNNATYQTLINSYLNNCSDSYVINLASKLKEKYNKLDYGYKNIANWWNSYNAGVMDVECKLMEGYTFSNDMVPQPMTNLGLLATNWLMPNSGNGQFNDKIISINEEADDDYTIKFEDTNDTSWWFVDFLDANKTPAKIINYLDKALAKASNNEDVYTHMMINYLYKFYRAYPSFEIKYSSRTCFWPEKKCLLLEERYVNNNIFPVFYHEMMHGVDYIFTKDNQDGYGTRCDSYQQAAMANPDTRDKLLSFTKTIYDCYTNIYNPIRDSDEVKKFRQSLESEVKLKDKQDIFTDINEALGLDVNDDSLGLESMSKDELEKTYVDRKCKDLIFNLTVTKYSGQGEAFASDIVSSMIRGEKNLDFGNQNVRVLGHSQTYFQNSDSVYREQFANFACLKIMGRQDLLNNLKDIYGNEWYDYLNNKYQNYALKLPGIE